MHDNLSFRIWCDRYSNLHVMCKDITLAKWVIVLQCDIYLSSLAFVFIPNIFVVDYKVTQKSFNFARKNHLPFHFVSASDGTNVVKVRLNMSHICISKMY